ncbi:hypothetical protein D3C80_2062820 [compost metagenome]
MSEPPDAALADTAMLIGRVSVLVKLLLKAREALTFFHVWPMPAGDTGNHADSTP